MYKQDFKDYDINNINRTMIERSGAILTDVNLMLILSLDKFCELIQRRICILANGLTTGKHSSTYHPRGLAVDIAFLEGNGAINIYEIWKAAIEAGFKGIGIYYNGTAYSIHLDMRPRLGLWSGWKRHGEKNWHYTGVFQDPKSFISKAA